MSHQGPDPAWRTSPSHSALVSIGTHSLFLRVSGPPRTSKQPVLILEAGAGASGSSYIALARECARFTRVYWYDRSGYGHSEKFPDGTRSTTVNHAKALRNLLDRAGIEPPWCLLGHSYGGNIMRCFIQEYGLGRDDVAGVLLLDSPPVTPGKRGQDIGSLLGPDGDYLEIVGLKDAIALTKEEIETVEADDRVGEENGAAKAEIVEIRPGVQELNEQQGVVIRDGKVVFTKQLLGTRRLCILKGGIRSDFEKIYNYSLKHGTGTEEARKDMKDFLDSWTEERYEQMVNSPVGLSNNSRVVQREGPGHTHELSITVP